MNIVLIRSKQGRTSHLHLGPFGQLVLAVTFLVALPAGGFYAGYTLTRPVQTLNHEEVLTSQALQMELETQRQAIDSARDAAESNLNALAMRLGDLQARINRIDALGSRLITVSALDDGEFDFNHDPAAGGPITTTELRRVEVSDFIAQLDQLSRRVEDRNQQLALMEDLMISSSVHDELFPSGRPIRQGWLSSSYGYRTDPFDGKKEFHKGLDFAGKEGDEVVAVARGVVTWSGERFGYGNLVEVNHGNGYVTRYGHNKENLVSVGDTVERGQAIAKMGSTGRSTGPHVHYEVLREGRQVNPITYVKAAAD